jgi:hypothetical protein
VIERLIVGRIKFTLRQNEVSDEVDGYAFEAVTRFDRLFTGIAVERPRNLDPMDRTGLDDIRPEDTMDAEYSQVLEQAYRQSSVVGSVPNGCARSVESRRLARPGDSGRRVSLRRVTRRPKTNLSSGTQPPRASSHQRSAGDGSGSVGAARRVRFPSTIVNTSA